MNAPILQHLLSAHSPARPIETVDAWWPVYCKLATGWPSMIERTIVGGFRADRLAWAFAGAYQCALRAMVPSLPEDQLCSLCVTEEGGTAPRAMLSSLQAHSPGVLRLNGSKRWTTLGPDGGCFLVAARDARLEGPRPAIRLIKLDSNANGVRINPMPPTPFVPEVPHAQLEFSDVEVSESDILPGDGYADYVKPFRTIEDLHVHAAVQAYLFGEGRRQRWPTPWCERVLSNLLALLGLQRCDPTAAATHIALSGALKIGMQLADECEPYWDSGADAEARDRWRRDRALLELASQPRDKRTANAWSQVER